MPQYSKEVFSESVSGRMVEIVLAATPGSLVHTTLTSATILDEIWLYATNTNTTSRELTVEWGNTDVKQSQVTVTLEAKAGHVLIIPGMILGSAQNVRAFLDVASGVNMAGWINRITP